MKDKDFGSVVGALAGAAKETPSIHQTEAEKTNTDKEGRATAERKQPMAVRNAQYLLKMRRDQRRQLTRLAAMVDMTIRGFILNALKDKGLDVNEEDMIDLRRTAEFGQGARQISNVE